MPAPDGCQSRLRSSRLRSTAAFRDRRSQFFTLEYFSPGDEAIRSRFPQYLRHSREMTLLCSRSLTQATRLRRGGDRLDYLRLTDEGAGAVGGSLYPSRNGSFLGSPAISVQVKGHLVARRRLRQRH